MDGDPANKNMKGMVISYKPVEDIVKNYLESSLFFFFGFEETSLLWKAHFVGPGEGVKPRLS
jgi:hypothetical protein